MRTRDTRFDDLLNAASALAYSREQGDDSHEEWDDLNRAVLAADEEMPDDAPTRMEFRGDLEGQGCEARKEPRSGRRRGSPAAWARSMRRPWSSRAPRSPCAQDTHRADGGQGSGLDQPRRQDPRAPRSPPTWSARSSPWAIKARFMKLSSASRLSSSPASAGGPAPCRLFDARPLRSTCLAAALGLCDLGARQDADLISSSRGMGRPHRKQFASAVDAFVFEPADDSKVFDSVVELVAVDMMNLHPLRAPDDS